MGTFGIKIVDSFVAEIYVQIEKLANKNVMHFVDQHFITKANKYRNIILGSYFIFYKTTTL